MTDKRPQKSLAVAVLSLLPVMSSAQGAALQGQAIDARICGVYCNSGNDYRSEQVPERINFDVVPENEGKTAC